MHSTRLLSEYRDLDEAVILGARNTAHASAQYNLHVVLCPVGHVAAIDETFAQPLLSYFLRVASQKGFSIARASILENHVHMLIGAPPILSPASIALTLMNNSSHWFAKTNPGAFAVWDIPGFWASSAFVGTVGEVTSAHIRNFLQEKSLDS